MIRHWPSSTVVSAWVARRRSFLRAFAKMASMRARASPGRFVRRFASSNIATISSDVVLSYQMSSRRMPAWRAIPSRYAATESSVHFRASAGVNPFSRAAMTTLAAIRLTSHSHGAGSVSSKSLVSNTSDRSGDANRPKFEMWASPQAWTIRPLVGVRDRSAAMTAGAPR